MLLVAEDDARAEAVVDLGGDRVVADGEPEGLGEGAGKLQPLLVPLGSGISGRVAATGTAIRIEDAQNDPRWQGQRYDALIGDFRRRVLGG